MLNGTLIAQYRGLKFLIIPSKKHLNKTYCVVRGSLHKYFNNGKHNANDFTIEDLQTVITELQQKFSINPDTAILRNMEFGVNIKTAVPTSTLLKNLVCYGNYTFTAIRIENVTVGKKIHQQRADLKIYDKGKQYQKPTQNLTRIEVAVNKMEFLKPYGITTLADLTNTAKIKPLGSLLVTYWNDIIYYDKQVNYKQLTQFEQKKLLYYATPRNWNDFDRKQRYRAKKHFNALMQKYSTSTTHKNIAELIGKKANDLTAVFCPQINHDFKRQNVHKLTYTIQRYNVDKSHINKTTKNTPKKTPKMKQKKCCVCGSDITHKKSIALYCSKRCNNSAHAKKRKQKRHKQKNHENKNLTKLLANLHKTNLRLLVEYKTSTGTYADHLEQNEIATTPQWVRCVYRVTVQQKTAPIVLNSYRARRLIKQMNIKN
ncbi:MAG: hypothetical protein ACK5NB_07995 [Flavobacteriaceae bacterium]